MYGQGEMLEPKDICRSARKTAKINQNVMAPLVGVSTTTMWRWEKGETTPPETYIAVCEVILRIAQDGDGLEAKIQEHLENIESQKRGPKAALFSLWGFCIDNNKRYILEEMAGKKSTVRVDDKDVDFGERGETSMEATFSMISDFAEFARERAMSKSPLTKQKWLEALIEFDGALAKMKGALHLERAFEVKDTEEDHKP